MSTLFRGMAPHMYNVFIKFGIQVTVYDKIKKYILPPTKEYGSFESYGRRYAAAIVASGVTLGLTYPLEVIQTLMMTNSKIDGQPKRAFTGTFPTLNFLHS